MSALDNILSIPSLKAEHPRQHSEAAAELAALRQQVAELKEALTDIENGDYHEPICVKFSSPQEICDCAQHYAEKALRKIAA